MTELATKRRRVCSQGALRTSPPTPCGGQSKHRNCFVPFAVAFLFFFAAPSIYGASVTPAVDWKDLSDRKLTDTGKAALAVYKDAWQHAETEYFVYHFHDAKEAETILIHTEVYYHWVKEIFGVAEDPKLFKGKSHIFIFDDKTLWKSFNQTTPEKLPGAEAFTNGLELFIYREPFWLEPQRVLAHEITHLVLHRFVKGEVPLFLNEGFAEFMATKAVAMKADGNEFNVRTFQLVPENEFIPLEELILLKRYPDTEEKNTIFYRESELLTRFLVLNYQKEKLYELLKETAAGATFEKALKGIYGVDLKTLVEKFKTYAMTRG